MTITDAAIHGAAPAGASPDHLRAQLRAAGCTPMVSIRLHIHGRARTVHLKLEGSNPSGSIKMRTALGLVQALESQPGLPVGSHLVESTSGNLGVALAMVARARGYRFTAVVDPNASTENVLKMEQLGAMVERVEEPDGAGGYLLSRLYRVRELLHADRSLVWTNQYGNAANPHAHQTWTAPEIFGQMQGRVDALFVAVSTCGTLAGLGRYFRTTSPSTVIVAVDALGSAVFSDGRTPRRLTGIGSSRRPTFAIEGLYDSFEIVDDRQAFTWCRALDESAGLQLGGSSGAVLAACARHLAHHEHLDRVVCVSADNGERYLSTIYDDAWLAGHGLDLSSEDLWPVEGVERCKTSW